MQTRLKLLAAFRVPFRFRLLYPAPRSIHSRVQDDHVEKALNSLERHTKEAYLPLLRSCDKLETLRRIHQRMIDKKVFFDKLLKNVLIEMYGKCGGLDECMAVFQSIQDRDGPNVFSWTVLIAAYARNGHDAAGLEHFHRMQLAGVRASEATLVVVIGITCKLGAPRGLRVGKKLHRAIEEDSVLASSSTVMTALLDMYSKCGCEGEARDIFENFHSTDTVWWTAMMAALVRCGDYGGALALHRKMNLEGIRSNAVTFVVALTACSSSSSSSSWPKVASQIHEESLARGLVSNPTLSSALVNLYCRHHNFQDSWNFFQELVTSSKNRSSSCWNSMMLCCARNGFPDRALQLYNQMAEAPIDRDEVTFSIALSCCDSAKDGEKVLLDAAAAGGRDGSNHVRSAAIDLYARSGHLDRSKQIFHKDAQCRSLSCWNALIGAYAQHGHGRCSLDLLLVMKLEGVVPDQLTFMSAMFASSHAGLLGRGVDCFLEMEAEHGIVPGPEHWRCLIDLLGRAGQIDGAEAIADENSGEMEWNILVGARKNQADEEVVAGKAGILNLKI